MGFFKKDKVNDLENIKPQTPPKNESSLAVVDDSDSETEMETIENDDVPIELPKKTIAKQILPNVESPEEEENEQSQSDLSFEEQEQILKEKIAEIQRQKQKALEEAEAKRQAEIENESFSQQYPQTIYLSESELLREINRKLDLLISLTMPK